MATGYIQNAGVQLSIKVLGLQQNFVSGDPSGAGHGENASM